MGPLTEKQERFVTEYLVDLNAAAAARRAGYSDNSASEQGYQLLQKTSVRQAVQDAMHERELRTQVTQDKVVQELSAIAFRDASDGSDTELRYCNKLRALELLGKHLGMFTDRVEANVSPMAFDVVPLSRRKSLLEEIARQFGQGQFDEVEPD